MPLPCRGSGTALGALLGGPGARRSGLPCSSAHGLNGAHTPPATHPIRCWTSCWATSDTCTWARTPCGWVPCAALPLRPAAWPLRSAGGAACQREAARPSQGRAPGAAVAVILPLASCFPCVRRAHAPPPCPCGARPSVAYLPTVRARCPCCARCAGRAARGPARYRQNPAGQGHGRGGGHPFLLWCVRHLGGVAVFGLLHLHPAAAEFAPGGGGSRAGLASRQRASWRLASQPAAAPPAPAILCRNA